MPLTVWATFSITNDGATIMKELGTFNSQQEKCLLKLPKLRDNEVGDGTTTAVILAGRITLKS